jgi:hypothetical protein
MRKKANNIDKSTNNIFALLGDEEQKTPYDWDDMPAYKQEEFEAYHTLNVRFRNEEDVIAFAKLLEQSVSNKTKAIWYPALDQTRNSLLRWMDEDTDLPEGEARVN